MRYLATFHTSIEVGVQIEADDEDSAADQAWEIAQAYLDNVAGDRAMHVTASANLDGIGAETVKEIQ
jgi:acyl-CoA hydrolase